MNTWRWGCGKNEWLGSFHWVFSVFLPCAFLRVPLLLRVLQCQYSGFQPYTLILGPQNGDKESVCQLMGRRRILLISQSFPQCGNGWFGPLNVRLSVRTALSGFTETVSTQQRQQQETDSRGLWGRDDADRRWRCFTRVQPADRNTSSGSLNGFYKWKIAA